MRNKSGRKEGNWESQRRLIWAYGIFFFLLHTLKSQKNNEIEEGKSQKDRIPKATWREKWTQEAPKDPAEPYFPALVLKMSEPCCLSSSIDDSVDLLHHMEK